MSRRAVYLNEYNIPMERTVYLPLVSGLLRCYAETDPDLREAYEFRPLLFLRDDPETIVGLHRDPAVAAFSVSLWNLRLSLAVARQVKERHPGCLIVFGGPSVPFAAQAFFREHPFVDVTVRGEGEQTFAEILRRAATGGDFRGVAGTSFRDPVTGLCVRNDDERPSPKDLDLYPSPYLEGVYDEIFRDHPELRFQAIVETNRGCPYLCSYCSWGQGGLSKRFRFFSLERVRAIADWCGAHDIRYVFCADSNFGVFKRDLEIARFFVEAKAAHGGVPEKFRVCYAKNAEETVFEVGKLLHSHDMEKGITLSRQTNSALAAESVGRKNIRMDAYRRLQRRYNREGIPVYTELILGLPGESYESFRDGIEEILQSGIRNQLFVYFCQVYPNTEFDDPAYRRRHGIETLEVPLAEIHGAVRAAGTVPEYEEIVVATATLSRGDWRRAALLAWVMQLLHGLKLGFPLMLYLVDRHGASYTDLFEAIVALGEGPGPDSLLRREVLAFHQVLDDVLSGRPKARELPEFGPLYWDVEEAAYLRLAAESDRFYDEFLAFLAGFLQARGAAVDRDELREVVAFQRALIPPLFEPGPAERTFACTVPDYFATFFADERLPLARRPQAMRLVGVRDFRGDRPAFAREVLMYGRKSDRMLNRYEPLGSERAAEVA